MISGFRERKTSYDVTPAKLVPAQAESGSPEKLTLTGFPPEFTPAQAEAGMTDNRHHTFVHFAFYD
jgi:hypothetical protein